MLSVIEAQVRGLLRAMADEFLLVVQDALGLSSGSRATVDGEGILRAINGDLTNAKKAMQLSALIRMANFRL